MTPVCSRLFGDLLWGLTGNSQKPAFYKLSGNDYRIDRFIIALITKKQWDY
jgi:hypothetical protein